jgi:hypothetical protein
MAGTAIRFSLSKARSIKNAAQQDVLRDGYKVFVTTAGVDSYTGPLDVDVRMSFLDSLLVYRSAQANWQASGGVVSVPAGAPSRPGIYKTRVKRAGAAASDWSPYQILMVDDRPVLNPNIAYTDATIRVPPPAGAFMIFENKNAAGATVGFTRLDIETSPCVLGGVTMRFTKTADGAYWSPGDAKTLRWCAREVQTPIGKWWLSPGGTNYVSPWPQLGAGRPTVSYPVPGSPEGSSVPALLGGYADFPPQTTLEVYDQPPDMWVFYAILPRDHRIPANLSSTPQTIIDLAFGRTAPPWDIDLWHMAAFAPNVPGAALGLRYVETGLRYTNAEVNLGWSVVEDWEWRVDGLVSKITQWRDVPPLCWRGNYRCVTPDKLAVTLNLVDWNIPDSQALRLSLWHPASGKLDSTLEIETAGSYELVATRADGKPYNGFLEIEILAQMNKQGQWIASAPVGTPPPRALWRDAGNLPIYVSNGRVLVGFAAHQIASTWGIMMRARPYLTNASLNTLNPKPDADLIPNTSTAPFSNQVTLTMGAV